MNTKIEIWNGHEIRFVEKRSNDWWAVAKDVADALGYNLVTNMTRLLDKQDRGTRKVNTLGGKQNMLIISECGIYEAIFNSRKPEAKDFKRWVFDVIKKLRETSGLETYQAMQMMNPEHQKLLMAKLNNGLMQPSKKDFIKSNTITNKAVSNMYGFDKMLKKEDMTAEMLKDREPILEDTVNLMLANESFGLGLSVSSKVYEKYCNKKDIAV